MATAVKSSPEVAVVKDYYDIFGWQKNFDGLCNDTSLFTIDTSASICRDLQPSRRAVSGRRHYLLDATSGAIPVESYLAFSAAYSKRFCVDLSVVALRDAKRKIGTNRGLFVLADMTCLPFVDNVLDDAVSLHTLYHVPQGLQTNAVRELVRVISPGGTLAAVYTRDRSELGLGSHQVAETICPVRQTHRYRSRVDRGYRLVGIAAVILSSAR